MVLELSWLLVSGRIFMRECVWEGRIFEQYHATLRGTHGRIQNHPFGVVFASMTTYIRTNWY